MSLHQGSSASKSATVAVTSSSTGVLQRQCACGTHTMGGGQCAECQKKKLGVGGRPLQTKLAISEPGDASEQEADRVAEQVMRMSPADVNKRQNGNRIQPLVQRRASSSATGLAEAPLSVHEVLNSPGRPLELALQQDMEKRFGYDFSKVRVHFGGAAEQSSRYMNANAYTVGHNIVFGAGQLSPGTDEGRRLIAHELTHVVQQSQKPNGTLLVQHKKGKGPGSCGLLSEAAATVLGGAAHVQIQNRLIGRGLAKELPIPRATKTAGVGSRKCQPLGTLWGFADVARIAKPVVSLSEIKPFWIAGSVGRFEVRHYRLRAEQSKQRLTGTGSCGKRGADADDHAFNALVGPLTASSTFDMLKGAIAGTEDFGPFSMDPHHNLLAKEVGGGSIGYWCKLNDEGKKKKKEEDKKKKEKKEQRKKKAAEKKKPTEKPKEKPKDKPKEKPKKPKPKTSISAGAGNLGLGISIFSTSVGGANAGVGISVGSSSAAVGTAGAGVSWFSDSAAAGAAGVGVAKDSTSAAAASAGAGISEDSESVSVGAAGAGKAKGTSSAGAGVASAGKSEDTQSAAAGAAGKGEVKDSMVAGAGGTGSGKVQGATGAATGSPKKPIDPKDVSGSNADKVPPGESDGEVAPEIAKPGQQGGKPAGEDEASEGEKKEGKEDGGKGTGEEQGEAEVEKEGSAGGGGEKGEQGQSGGQPSQPGGKQPGGQGGQTSPPGTTGQQGQQQGGGSVKPGAGTGTSPVNLGVLPVFPFDASDADREKAAAEAAKVALLLKDAQQAQNLLLEYLANKETNGQYLVPTSQWVQKLLNATKGLKPEDLEYLKKLDWRPGSISEEELRKRVLKSLENRNKPRPADSGDVAKPAKKPGEGMGGGSGAEGGGVGPGKEGKGTKGSGGGGKKGTEGPQVGKVDKASAPPPGSDRTAAGVFMFKILSGITALSQLKPEQAVSCKILVVEKDRMFELSDVSVTFVGRDPDKEVVVEGGTYISTVFKLRFTNDFWSEKYHFYGRGGADSLTNYEFRRKKGK